MDFFFDKGKLLKSNKEQKIKSFFSPIDRLFGDYERRKLYPTKTKKQGSLSQLIYRKTASNEPFKILKEEIIEELKNQDSLLGLVISEVEEELRLDYFWTTSRELIKSQNKTTKEFVESKVENCQPKFTKYPLLILEPTYLFTIAPYIEDFIDARIGQYDDGMYVVFLHPCRNESDMPIRIPRPPKAEQK